MLVGINHAEERVGMAKPNFSGVYSLKSSENEDAFLKAQGVGWVLRKAAKAGESERARVGANARTRKNGHEQASSREP